jgi:hypothetical protein
MAKSSKAMIMIPVLGLFAMFGCFSFVIVAIVLLNRNTSGSKIQSATYSESYEYGDPGNRDWGALCPEGQTVKKILTSTKDVGPKVVGKRHARVNHIGVLCSKGGKKFGVGESSDMNNDISCKGSSEIIGLRAWTTDDAVQRVEPICTEYAQFSPSEGLGSSIGDNNKYICPGNMYLNGLSGTITHELKSIKAHCGVKK